MTTEKLTAKLSDGTEWKVVSNEPTAKGSENRVVWLMPLKPSPPKEVLVRIYSDGTVGHAFAKEQFPEDDNTCTHHRYTLAPEPDRKPAREWWEVRYPNDPATVNSFTSREKAESFMQYFGATSNTYEIVHVREVVE